MLGIKKNYCVKLYLFDSLFLLSKNIYNVCSLYSTLT